MNSAACIHHFDERFPVDRDIVIRIDAEIDIERQRQEARTRAWIIPIMEAVSGISIEISLIEFFMILPIEMAGDIRNLDPKVAGKIEHGYAWLDKVHTHQAHHIR